MSKLRLSAGIVGLLALQACASAEKVVVAQPGVPFSLLVGETAVLNGSQLTFTRVSADSRCPANAVCVWEGEARIEVRVARDGGAGETRIIQLRPPPENETRIGDLIVRFVSLSPYPGTFDENRRPPYVAKLEIRKA